MRVGPLWGLSAAIKTSAVALDAASAGTTAFTESAGIVVPGLLARHRTNWSQPSWRTIRYRMGSARRFTGERLSRLGNTAGECETEGPGRRGVWAPGDRPGGKGARWR